LAGGAIRPVDAPNPAPEWITERIWLEVLTLESLEPFKGCAQNFRTYLQEYKQIFDSSEPERLVHLLKKKLMSNRAIHVFKSLLNMKRYSRLRDYTKFVLYLFKKKRVFSDVHFYKYSVIIDYRE
jgi:dynein heavy chain